MGLIDQITNLIEIAIKGPIKNKLRLLDLGTTSSLENNLIASLKG